jgi:hypothetical protein
MVAMEALTSKRIRPFVAVVRQRSISSYPHKLPFRYLPIILVSGFDARSKRGRGGRDALGHAVAIIENTFWVGLTP